MNNGSLKITLSPGEETPDLTTLISKARRQAFTQNFLIPLFLTFLAGMAACYAAYRPQEGVVVFAVLAVALIMLALAIVHWRCGMLVPDNTQILVKSEGWIVLKSGLLARDAKAERSIDEVIYALPHSKLIAVRYRYGYDEVFTVGFHVGSLCDELNTFESGALLEKIEALKAKYKDLPVRQLMTASLEDFGMTYEDLHFNPKFLRDYHVIELN